MWPRGQSSGSAVARFLGLRFRISLGSWMSEACKSCVSGRRRADHSSRGILPSVVCLECDREASKRSGSGPLENIVSGKGEKKRERKREKKEEETSCWMLRTNWQLSIAFIKHKGIQKLSTPDGAIKFTRHIWIAIHSWTASYLNELSSLYEIPTRVLTL